MNISHNNTNIIRILFLNNRLSNLFNTKKNKKVDNTTYKSGMSGPEIKKIGKKINK